MLLPIKLDAPAEAPAEEPKDETPAEEPKDETPVEEEEDAPVYADLIEAAQANNLTTIVYAAEVRDGGRAASCSVQP